MARQNPGWGTAVSKADWPTGPQDRVLTVWEILKKAGIDPSAAQWPAGVSSVRSGSPDHCVWFMHVDTVLLRRLYVLIFIEHGTRDCTSPV